MKIVKHIKVFELNKANYLKQEETIIIRHIATTLPVGICELLKACKRPILTCCLGKSLLSDFILNKSKIGVVFKSLLVLIPIVIGKRFS